MSAQIFDLFMSLNATEEQMMYPLMFASGREGWATTKFTDLDGAGGRKFGAYYLHSRYALL